MDTTSTSGIGARYSHLQPIFTEENPIQSRSMSSNETLDTYSSTKRTKKRGMYGRAIVFILLETSFLTFVYYCLIHPIPLQSHPDSSLGILPSLNITLTEFKAGVTAASVVWHSLAGLVIKDIIAVVCSAEFMAQYHQLGDLDHRTSDRVSTLTSGLVDNIVHFASFSATGTFHLAFVVMVILMVIGPLGSGTVMVGIITTTTNEQIQVTNLTGRVWQSSLVDQQIPLMMRIEREQNETFKYDMLSSLSSDPVLIPWPINVSLPEQSTLIYQSDILHFRFECAWMAPSTVENHFPSSLDITSSFDPKTFTPLVVDNTFYDTEGAASVDDSYGILVMFPLGSPHTLSNATIVFVTKEFPDFPLLNKLTLSGLPHVLSVKNSSNTAYIWQTAFLRCYPDSRIIPAVVTLAQNTLTAGKLPESMKGTTLIGNILPPEAEPVANLLTSAIVNYKPSADQMFLKIRSRDSMWASAELELLSLEEMSTKINFYMQSAGKAYLGGIAPTPFVYLSNDVVAMNQTAQITFPVSALVSSKPFLIAFTIVIGLILILLVALLWTIRQTELILFNLQNLTEILGSKHGQNA